MPGDLESAAISSTGVGDVASAPALWAPAIWKGGEPRPDDFPVGSVPIAVFHIPMNDGYLSQALRVFQRGQGNWWIVIALAGVGMFLAGGYFVIPEFIDILAIGVAMLSGVLAGLYFLMRYLLWSMSSAFFHRMHAPDEVATVMVLPEGILHKGSRLTIFDRWSHFTNCSFHRHGALVVGHANGLYWLAWDCLREGSRDQVVDTLQAQIMNRDRTRATSPT